MLKNKLAGFILLYQKFKRANIPIPILTLGSCRFYPSCSEYARMAVLKYGALKGLTKSFTRIVRCNPLYKGGFDPLK